MGPGPQPGHRAQLSPQRLVKDITACPSPQHLLSPGSSSGACMPPRLFGQTCLCSCVCLHLKCVSWLLTPPPLSLFIPVVCFSFLSVSLSR